jgi:V/A-type H+/Na+-transporting ATPase subunit E
MEGKLQELTQRLYHEGVEKANAEGKALIEKAKRESDSHLAKTKAEAEALILRAQKESEQIKAKALSEVKMAAEQAVTTLKNEVANLLSSGALTKAVSSSLNDVLFIQSLIKDIVAKWDGASAGNGLLLILPETKRKELDEIFKAKSSDMLKNGLEIKFEGRMEGGFKLEPKDGSFVLSFTEKDFNQFFQSFLKVRAKEILFPSEKA